MSSVFFSWPVWLEVYIFYWFSQRTNFWFHWFFSVVFTFLRGCKNNNKQRKICDRDIHSLQSLKYFLSDSLQKKFIDSPSILGWLCKYRYCWPKTSRLSVISPGKKKKVYLGSAENCNLVSATIVCYVQVPA